MSQIINHSSGAISMICDDSVVHICDDGKTLLVATPSASMRLERGRIEMRTDGKTMAIDRDGVHFGESK